MSNNVTVYRLDGSLQCGMGTAEPLDAARADLEMRVGSPVGKGENKPLPFMFIACCGAPTGRASCFEISPDQCYTLFHGTIGPGSWCLWEFPDVQITKGGPAALGETPFPFALVGAIGSALSTPVLFRDAYGFMVRVYHRGDAITKDYRRDRMSIMLDENHRIVDIGFF